MASIYNLQNGEPLYLRLLAISGNASFRRQDNEAQTFGIRVYITASIQDLIVLNNYRSRCMRVQ